MTVYDASTAFRRGPSSAVPRICATTSESKTARNSNNQCLVSHNPWFSRPFHVVFSVPPHDRHYRISFTPSSSYLSSYSSLFFLIGTPFPRPVSRGRTHRFLAWDAKFIKGPRILYSVSKTQQIDFLLSILRRRHFSILFTYRTSFA